MSSLPSDVAAWLTKLNAVQSVVLFGSSIQAADIQTDTDRCFDLDLHVVADRPELLEQIDWPAAVPQTAFCVQTVRPATGGVRKVTAVFDSGQIDLVIVPASALRIAGLAMCCGFVRRGNFIDEALNEMATCLHTGYRFLKGEMKWGAFYARIAKRPGVRLSDEKLRVLANSSICDLLWVLQKTRRGEIVAAQHSLHGKVVDVNLRLWRELRFRRNLPVPSFGLGRRFEFLSTEPEKRSITVSARADSAEIQAAAWHCFDGLTKLMAELVQDWSLSPQTRQLLERYRAVEVTPAR